MLVIFFITLFCGAPIILALSGSAMIAINTFSPIGEYSIASKIFTALNSFTLVAMPCFLLAGNIMQNGGISDRLVAFCEAFLGRRRGAMGMVAIFACMLFGAISGSGVAAIAAMGMVMLPILKEKGFDDGYSASLVATAGGLGVIIPPSLPMISFCLMAECSVGAMFMCGIGPGILTGVGFMIVNWIVSLVKGYGRSRDRALSFKEFIHVMKRSIPAVLMPVIILGGIYGGFFTSSEAACVAVVYGVVVSMFIFKTVKWKDLRDMLFEATRMSGSMLLIYACCQAFVYVLTIEQVPTKLATFVSTTFGSQYGFIWAFIAVLLIIGCFMEVKVAVMILTPLLVPICKVYGYSVMQLGILMICTLNIGGITPPYGLSMFITSGISGTPVSKMIPWLILFTIISILLMVPLVYFPEITLFIPKAMGMSVM